MSSVTLALFMVLALVLCLLPMIIASYRNHTNQTAITVCNIIGLFTGIFWVVALGWAFTGKTNYSRH